MSDNQIHENEDGYPARPVSVVPYSPAEQMPSNNERPFTGGVPCGICRKAAATLRLLYTTASELVQAWENVLYTKQKARKLMCLAEDNIHQSIMKIKGIKKLECYCQSSEQRTCNDDSSVEPLGQDIPVPGVGQLQQHRMGQLGQQRERERSNLPASGYMGGGGYSFGQAGQTECPPQPPGQWLGRPSRLDPAQRSNPQKHPPSSSRSLSFSNNSEPPYSSIPNSQDNPHGQMLNTDQVNFPAQQGTHNLLIAPSYIQHQNQMLSSDVLQVGNHHGQSGHQRPESRSHPGQMRVHALPSTATGGPPTNAIPRAPTACQTEQEFSQENTF